MKTFVRLSALVGVCIGLAALLGAPWSGALLSGVVMAGVMLHGVRCDHPDPILEPSTFQRGIRRPPHWYCPDCGRTWSVQARSRQSSPPARAAS